jgi:hypothetical protein
MRRHGHILIGSGTACVGGVNLQEAVNDNSQRAKDCHSTERPQCSEAPQCAHTRCLLPKVDILQVPETHNNEIEGIPS